MSKRARPGYVSLTIDIPIEVVEWLAANAESLGNLARTASIKAHRTSKEGKQENEARLHQRQKYFANLGRDGYRKLRKAGITKGFVKNREVAKTIAPQLGVTWQALELAVTRHKRNLDELLRKRREREIGRMYWAGMSNKEIARRQNIHPNSVARCIKEIIEKTGRRA